ncbi:aspartic peptidase domain-containing protein [Roridomyces roridus]|uniref:Aspartic peptidase domain-containing protein n=1 Tax=Roridomyces roridus TaxID=1738132 RepID=A0AAD7BQB0_9AGAR|nr:aspartic peptidase domain-containing protein [Roridomyces roridus]
MAEELPPQIVSEIQLSGWVFVASSAVFVWHILNHLADDYAILLKHKLRLPALAYVSTRIASLVYVIGFTIFTSVSSPFRLCILILNNVNAPNTFYPVACFSISLLFFFRVRAIYGGHRVATAVFGFLCAFVLGANITVPIGSRASPHPIGKLCLITEKAPQASAAGYMVAAAILPINDTAVFLAISFRLLANSRTKHTRKESVKALFEILSARILSLYGLRVLKTTLDRVTVVSNLVTLCMVYIPSISPIYHGMLSVPNIALSSIMACRVYRNTTLHAARQASVSFEIISPDGFTIPSSAASSVHFVGVGEEFRAEHTFSSGLRELPPACQHVLLELVLSVLLLASSCAAAAPPVRRVDSIVTLPISKKFNFTGTKTLLEHDITRVTHLRDKVNARLSGASPSAAAVVSDPVVNTLTSYIATVQVGDPPASFDLIVDTGSSNTWVGATTHFVQTETTLFSGESVEVTYGSGDFAGIEVFDQVEIAPGLVIADQAIGVAATSIGFDGVDGILGIGPVDLTLGTLSPDSNLIIPTVTDNLFSQKTITNNMIGISFEPTTSVASQNGAIAFGGTDSTKFTGPITFTNVTNVAPASEFWGINQSLRYGDSTTIFSNLAGIVDTGTTLLLLPTSGFNAYVKATGAVLDQTTGLLQLTPTQFSILESLFFEIDGVSFEFTPNAQLWPRVLNTAIGGQPGSIYLIVNSLGASTETGFDFVNGMVFLERFYSVYDTANSRVGFAVTPFTTATTN